jgi:hypothetical protein
VQQLVVHLVEEVLEEAHREQILQVQEEEENGKNTKKYNQGLNRSGMDSSWNVYCLGSLRRQCKNYRWLWNYGNPWSLDYN